MAYDIQPQDIPFHMFSILTGNNKMEYLSLLFLLEEMMQTEYKEAISFNLFMEEVLRRELMGQNTEEDRIESHVRILANSKIIRRLPVYNDENKSFEDSLSLTGYGRKLLVFIKDITRPDLDESRDYQITNARRNIRDLASRRELPDNRADILMSVYSSLRDLIYHLSNFSAEFSDFVTRISKERITNARAANDWINQIMNSKYIIEFNTICDDSLGYVSQVSEIARVIETIMKNDTLTELIIRDRERKAEELRKKAIKDLDKNEIEREIKAQMRRIHSMAATEYRMYIFRIAQTVNKIIKRTYIMYSSFGADKGMDNMVTRLMQTLLYIDSTRDEDIVEGISNIYYMSCFTEESLIKPFRKNDEETDYPAPVYLLNSQIKNTAPLITRRTRVRQYLQTAMKEVYRIRLDSLPCENDKDFYRLVRIVMFAAGQDSEKKEFGIELIEGEPDRCVKGIYTIPNIYIVKMAKV